MSEESMPSTLAGFASLPADTFAAGPTSGNDSGDGTPIDANGRVAPFDGQPVQGFSGVQFAPDSNGAFWFLSDNGFGAQSNSADYLLRLYQVDPNFTGETENGDGTVEVQDFIQLSDPNNLIPFEIINEATEDRLLTGGDFDLESFVIDNNGEIWIGEEFGPYVLHFNSDGELVEAPVATPNVTNFNTLNGQEPIVIGHRGASGVLPEHTLEAYATAIAQGADFIEPDLVTTSDGVLIARHEPILDDTTNVAEVFGQERKSTKILDGELVTAYFAEDFTLDEIKQLRAVQPRDFRSQDFNNAFEIPTFKEVIKLVQETEAETGLQVGIYPETKHPTFFNQQGLSLEEPLIATLQETGFTDPNRIFIQSFEFQNLIELQGMLDAVGLGDIPLVQLYGDTTETATAEDGFSVPYDIRYNLEQDNDLAAIYGQEFLAAVENGLSENTTYRDLDNAEFLQIIAEKYAEGAGPWKNNILLRESLAEPVDGDGDGVAEITTQLTGEVTSFIEDAHAAGLQVHPYTFRNEELYLTLDAEGTPQTPEAEIQQLIEIGADGFFTDFPATGAAVVNSLAGEFVQSPENPNLGEGIANLSSSRGFEGMAFSPDRMTLYPLLEGTVAGDPENALRIYQFDVASSSFNGLVGYYPTTDGNPIGDFTPINESEFLVIERDNQEGETAEFKKIFKINLNNIDANGFVEKTEIVDLLNIADPNDLNGDGNTTYDMPFVTIEDVVVIDEDTILVANDNNYPFSQGREGDIDNNEVVLIDLDQPLNLDPNLGGIAVSPTFLENNGDTNQPAQMTGLNNYSVDPIFTVGEKIGDYAPPGIPDGLGAYALDEDTIRVFANHELTPDAGYTYTLANGTELTGARVSFFDINKETLAVENAGLAYDTIINRAGEEVNEAGDLEFEGINRLCSAQYIEAHQFGEGRGLEDAMFFTGEETDGGTEFVINPETKTLHAIPWMGRAAWESVTELDTGTTDKVALLVGDDREAAPLLMYVGEKDSTNPDDFLARNGLAGGKLYFWKPDGDVADTPTFVDEDGEEVDADNAPDPAGFNGTGNSLNGSWVELDYYRPDLAGTALDTNDDGEIQDEMGYDELGFATQAQQDQMFIDAGGFQFSRPEDVATNPEDGTQAVLASTGRDGRFAEDKWGTTLKINTDFNAEGNPVSAQIDILYDGDDAGAGQFESPDFGLRSPDNVEWADDGSIYVHEDRSYDEFGLTSGEEASIWNIEPDSGELTRVAQMDRSAVPEGQTDGEPEDIGNWESSGIIDVSHLFDQEPGTKFLFDVQAHSLGDGIIETEELVEGGQLAFLNQEVEPEPEATTAKNVIVMIGDGMGWEIARAAAIQAQINQGAEGNTLSEFYTEGTGTGLSFQNLEGYAIANTSGTYIDGDKENSALEGDTLERETGVAPIREGFEPENLPGEAANGEFLPAQIQGFFPELRDGEEAPILGEFDPNFDEDAIYAQTEEGEIVQVGGFLNAYDTSKGRALPWLEDADPDYPKNLFPDSANTATTLYSGVKSYNAAIGVDIYEDDLETIGEAARELGKSFGVVSSVPFNHATPGSAVGHVGNRNKTTATESIENFEVVLDENGVPVHEDHQGESEPVLELDENGNPIPIEDDNILYQILNETQPEVILGGGHPDGRGDEQYMDLATLEQLRNGETVYTFTERGENAAEVLAQTASEINVNEEEKLFGLYGARGQGGNLPWSTANGDYSNLGLSSRLDAERPLESGETDEEFIASEIDANPTLAQMTTAALDVLGDDEDGFWVSIEGGDIDWAAHDNNLDNMIGATLDFADSVEVVQDWIAENGGYEENMLVVTADHDHYLTLNEDFPELLREYGAEALTTTVDDEGNVLATNVDNEGVPLVDDEGNPFSQKVDNLDPEASGHYWGSDPDVKVGWSHHTTIPVPVYYQGAGSEYLDNSVGEGFTQYGFEVPGVDGLIDQVHIAEAQFAAFGTVPGENRDIVNLLGAEDLNVNLSAEVNAGFANIGGFYQAIDAEGTVIDPISGEEIALGQEGYEAAALANSVAELGDTETATVNLESGFVYVPYLLADGVEFFTAFAAGNADGIDRVQSLAENTFGFEDLPSGGDRDFDDYVINVSFG